MDESQGRKSKLQEFIELIKIKIFGVMLELLKEKRISTMFFIHIGTLYMCFLMLVMFVQFIGYLFDSNVFYCLPIE